MFFIGIFGTGQKVVPENSLPTLRCPVCKQEVQMSLCRKYDYFHAFFIPLVKYGAVYWATCPKCASVFSLRKEVGNAIHQGKMIPIGEQDLELVRNNYLPSCPACGAPQVPGSLFCNRCGAKL